MIQKTKEMMAAGIIVLWGNLGAVLALAGLPVMQAEVPSERPLHFQTKQCNEDAIEVRLDPRPLQNFVESGFPLMLEEGKARVLIVVHDCMQYWVDGEDLGPAQEVQVWISIHGLDDVRPVVGAEQTLPTRTWFVLFAGSSNPRVRAAKGAAGMVVHPVESVLLDQPGAPGGGRVSLGEGLSYSWQVSSPAKPAARMVGMNFDVYARGLDGNIVLNRIQALLHVSAGASQGALNITGKSNSLPWLGPGTYPVSVRKFFPMWSRTWLGLPPARGHQPY
jgi:hypothetical protein